MCAPLTLTAASVRCQLESWVTGTSVAAQRVQTALLAVAVVRPGALVHFCKNNESRLTLLHLNNSDLSATSLTFKEVSCEARLVDRAIRDELEPQLVGTAVDVAWLLVTAETAEQRAALGAAIPHLHVVVGTAVVELNLESHQEAKQMWDIYFNRCFVV